jgi:hypothetical protein
MSKSFETFVKDLTASMTQSGARVINLAQKHGIHYVKGNFFNAGSPGIMNSSETVDIELQWWWSWFHNADKAGRFNQFAEALEAVEAYSDNAADHSNIALYTKLNVYGRAMFAHAISLKDDKIKDSIFARVSKYAKDGLDMEGTQYKDSIKVQHVYDIYLQPKFKDFENCEIETLDHIPQSSQGWLDAATEAVGALFQGADWDYS